MTVNCAKEAVASGVKRFIQMSCARVYDCDKVGVVTADGVGVMVTMGWA